jgi:PAS domain S-box-containing protein
MRDEHATTDPTSRAAEPDAQRDAPPAVSSGADPSGAGDDPRALFDGAAIGMLVTDAQGWLVDANAAACELLGYERAELASRSLAELTHDDDLASCVELGLQQPGDVVSGQCRMRHKSGRYLEIESRARVLRDGRSVIAIEDVTAADRAREAEQALRELNRELRDRIEELQTVIELSPVGIAVAEDPACRTIRANRALQEILQIPAGANASRSAPPGEMPLYRLCRDGREVPVDELPMQYSVAHGVAVDNVELQVVRSDGTTRTILNSVRPLYDEVGSVRGAISFCTDITERQKVEQALRDVDRRKDEFLAVLSHELRNPMAPIRNSLYVLERVPPGGDQATRALAVIDRQIGHMHRLVDDLLDVSRVMRGKISLRCEQLDLRELFGRVVEDHRSVFVARGIALEVAFADRPAILIGDRTRLTQVIGNLLQNAAKFTPTGGRVELSMEVDAGGGACVLRVRDTGAGIEPAIRAYLFEPFMQADNALARNGGGLGLGLALVKGLVALHGGTVEVHSDGPGAGAEFVVTLPLTGRAPSNTQPTLPLTRPRRRRVLVIEDNIDAADTLRDALQLDLHHVTVAYSGPEGLARARESCPEVVLCDIGLPGMDGYEVARAFRADEALRSVTLVALTGYALPQDRNRALEAGFDHHLAKPPRLAKLKELFTRLESAGRRPNDH